MNSDFSNIVHQLQVEGSSALATLYTQYRREFIVWLVTRKGCDQELAKDIYQQSILALYENVQSGRLTELTSSVKTYLFGIGKNKYLEVLRQQEKDKRLMHKELLEADLYKEALLQKVEVCLQQLGEPCRSLLMQYYYHKRSVDQLAELFQYKNTDTAKNQKYKCLERLRKMVKDTVRFSMDKDELATDNG